MAAPVIFDGRAGRFRWPRRSFSMAAPVGFDGRAGHFRWPRRSFSMAAPVDNCVPMKHSTLVNDSNVCTSLSLVNKYYCNW